MLKYKKI